MGEFLSVSFTWQVHFSGSRGVCIFQWTGSSLARCLLGNHCWLQYFKHTVSWLSVWLNQMYGVIRKLLGLVSMKKIVQLESPHWGRDRMAAILKKTFSNSCSSIKIVIIRFKFHWNMFARSNWQYAIIGSDNGLVPIRRQAIIWTSDGLV